MKRMLDAFFMCFGMFTSIPCPYRPWNEDARNLMIPFLPLVGALLGGLWCALAFVLRFLACPAPLFAACLLAFPYLTTGFIHLDGYMDTTDAILSWRPLEERLRILKDPHTGSFAVVSVAILFLFGYGACESIVQKSVDPLVLMMIPSSVRAAAAIAVSTVRPLGHSQYGAKYKSGVKPSHLASMYGSLVLSLILSLIIGGFTGFIGAFTGIAGYLLAALCACQTLKGISGDVSGFALTVGETAALIALAIL